MERFEICGGRPLVGTVKVQGAKNAALPMLAAVLMAEGESVLENVPDLLDIRVMAEIISQLGGTVMMDTTSDTIRVNSVNVYHPIINDEQMRKMRSSLFLLGPLLARFGEAELSLPGGCPIGERKIDIHISSLQAMGAKYESMDNRFRLSVPGGRLQGAHIRFRFPSVGATENVMMAACCAEGTTVIEHAAKEPEVVNLQDLLNAMGADVQGAGTDRIQIRGVQKLSPAHFRVMPDRIVTGTWMLAAAVTNGELMITDTIPDHIKPLAHIMKQCGVDIRTGPDGLLHVNHRQRHRANERVITAPYPLFPTDLQAQLMVFLATADGRSIIRETIFEHRFQHVTALRRMGAQIRLNGNEAMIQGVDQLVGADVDATDLRAGAAMVLAALAAQGSSVIRQTVHIDRGYAQWEHSLNRLGAQCNRITANQRSGFVPAG